MWLLDEFLPHLSRINSAFDRSWVEPWMFAAPFAQIAVAERLVKPMVS